MHLRSLRDRSWSPLRLITACARNPDDEAVGRRAACAQTQNRAPHTALERPQALRRAYRRRRARRVIVCSAMPRARQEQRTSVTAHTLDDQAETSADPHDARQRGRPVWGRWRRLTPLPSRCGMARLRSCVRCSIFAKSRLIATPDVQRKFLYADDPSNRDPRFTRARLRDADGRARGRKVSTHDRLAQLARRLKRAEGRDRGARSTVPWPSWRRIWRVRGALSLEARRFDELPAEIALRAARPRSGQGGRRGSRGAGKARGPQIRP